MTVSSFALLIITLLLGLICRYNFGKGLNKYLKNQDLIDESSFLPVFPARQRRSTLRSVVFLDKSTQQATSNSHLLYKFAFPPLAEEDAEKRQAAHGVHSNFELDKDDNIALLNNFHTSCFSAMGDFDYDCVVVGSGHAGSCAAYSAVQSGCKQVLIVEKAPKDWAGGNGYFTAGAHRTTHQGLQDLLPILHNVTPERASTIDMEPYSAEDFMRDIMRLSGGKSERRLAQEIVDSSRETVQWLAQEVGVRFILSFNRQAYEVEGRQKFWGGLVLSVIDGGKGLIADDHAALEMAGVTIWFDSPAIAVLKEENSVSGLVVERNGTEVTVKTPSVVLACGGFEANRSLRGKHLGEPWTRAHVRGTPFNTGDGLSLATALGAKLTGDFSGSGCHSTCWDAHANPNSGDRVLSNQYTKSGYPLGLMVNAMGHRFVDEGADFRNYTYAAYGRAILAQPGSIAFQVYDNQVAKWLRKEEYADDIVQKIFANNFEELAQKLVAEGLEEPSTFVDTINKYNEAVAAHRAIHPDLKWDPSVKDGLSTISTDIANVDPPKSNWALPLIEPPFFAVKVTCGITFTFGGLAIDPESAGVIAEGSGQTIPGLFCAGELVGGVFYTNYPGGSGLTSGAVFGRKAGKAAGGRARLLRKKESE